MNNKYAVIENGIVTNIIIWDGETSLGELTNKLVMLPEYFVDLGFYYADGSFAGPAQAIE